MTTDSYCRKVLVLAPGDVLPWRPCPDCGHTGLVHVGVDHCPVCELVAIAEQHRTHARPLGDSPKPGDRLHLYARTLGCLAGTVEDSAYFTSGLLIKIDRVDISPHALVADLYDESRSVNGSWHWPCDADAPPPAPDRTR